MLLACLTRKAAQFRWSVVGAAVFAAAVACSSKTPALRNEQPPGGTFEPVAPRVYVAKVKNILVGLPPSDAELRAVEADPGALAALVDAWMQLPSYAWKMMRFFELAFQQTQIGSNDFADQVFAPIGKNDTTTPFILQNVQESFARTMVDLTASGHPLTEAMTTRRIMMTTALKELYAFLDVVDIDDGGIVFDHFRESHRDVQIVAEASQGPIPLAQTLDPTSPSYMHWYDPDVRTAGALVPGCQKDPVLLPIQAITLHWLLLGSLDGRKLADGTLCPVFGGTADAPQLTASDFGDWTMVSIRPPNPGEATATFYDLPTLRSAKELVLSTPRIGFFSTPAFLANWQTNVTNQMRVTMHQTLIVATGSSVDGTDATLAPGAPGLDATHAGQPECLVCHAILDPTRSVFSSTWSWYYHRQLDPAWTSQPGVFAFRGVVRPVRSLADLGDVLAAHPLVAPGWVQKLCFYVSSAPCDERDPELLRLVDLFRASSYSWTALVKALVTSPMTTGAAETATARKNGEIVAVARRDHLCAALDARLGLTDVCGLDALAPGTAGTPMPEIVAGLPADAYGRGAVAPVLPNQPTLFFRAGIENICETVAAQVIGAAPVNPSPNAKHWTSDQADAAIADFVSIVMALAPSDPRAEPARALLSSHFASARRQPGITPTDALRSTFVVACMAPSAVSVGL